MEGTKTVRYTILREPLNPRSAITGCVPAGDGGVRASDVVRAARASGLPALRLYSVRRGQIADPDKTMLQAGDHVVGAPGVAGLSAIALIALGVLAVGTAAYTAYAYQQAQAQMRRLKGQDPSQGDAAASQAYSFSATQNPQVDSIPIPVLYGRTKVGGTVINRFLYAPEGGAVEYARLLIALGQGEFTAIAPDGASDIIVDNTTLDTYQHAAYEVRLGTSDQEPVSFFQELYQQKFPDLSVANHISFYVPLYDSSFENHGLCLPDGDSTTSACYSGVSSYAYFTLAGGKNCLQLASENAWVRYDRRSNPLVDAFSDALAVQAWIYVSTSQWNAMETNEEFIFFSDLPYEEDIWRWYGAGLKKLDSNTFRIWFRCNYYDSTYEDWKIAVEFSSATMDKSEILNAWHHFYYYRSGSSCGVFLDGANVTDPEATILDKTDSRLFSFRNGSSLSKLRAYIGWDPDVKGLDTLICYMQQLVVHVGRVPYIDEFEPPPMDTDLIDYYSEANESTCTINGAADSIHWSYRLPSGLFGFRKTDSKSVPWHARFQEWIELQDGHIIYLCDKSLSGDAGIVSSTDVTGQFTGTLTWSRTFRFDYIQVGTVTGGPFWYGEYVETATGGGRARIAGIFDDASRLYLADIENESAFTAGQPVTGSSSGASATIGAGGIVIAEVVEDPILHLRKVSTSYQSSMEFCNATRLYAVASSRRLALSYPYTALLALEIAAQDKIAQVPNVNLIAERMTAELPYWTGSDVGYFEADLTNPAWAAWDLMTNERYGLGVHPRNMDRDSWLSWAAWCDEHVPIAGSAETEPRARINVVFDEKNKKGWDLLDVIFQVGRAVRVDHGATYYAKILGPRDPVMHISSAMIVPGSVTVEWVDPQTQPDKVIIEYLDAETRYTKQAQAAERPGYDDPENEYRKIDTIFIPAITSAGQARREAILRLQTQRAAVRRFSWEMDIEAITLEPGDVVTLASGSNIFVYGGVLRDVSGTSVRLDRTILLKGSMYDSSHPMLRSRNMSTDAAIEAEIVGPWDVETDTIEIAETVTGLSAGAPYAISRDGDSDTVEIEEIVVTEDQHVKVSGVLYDDDAYYHEDYGDTPL